MITKPNDQSMAYIIQMLNNYLATLAPGVRETVAGAIDYHVKDIESRLAKEPKDAVAQ